jgi:hypothetical protein
VLRPDDSAVREIEDVLQVAERSGDDFALGAAATALGFALVDRHTAAERDRGQKLLARNSEERVRAAGIRPGRFTDPQRVPGA